MRLYFRDASGTNHIAIDTDLKKWMNDASDNYFLFPNHYFDTYGHAKGFGHRWLSVSENDMRAIEREIDFNGWDWCVSFDEFVKEEV